MLAQKKKTCHFYIFSGYLFKAITGNWFLHLGMLNMTSVVVILLCAVRHGESDMEEPKGPPVGAELVTLKLKTTGKQQSRKAVGTHETCRMNWYFC